MDIAVKRFGECVVYIGMDTYLMRPYTVLYQAAEHFVYFNAKY